MARFTDLFIRQLRHGATVLVVAIAALLTQPAEAQLPNFEARHVHPIALTPDGTRLVAVNSLEGRLSVFDVSNAANPEPVLIAEIPVGIEPVSVRARTNDEVWVVNEVTDSVSIVSLSRMVVTDTIRTVDEPADVVFASGKAFVTCARSNAVKVIDVSTHAEITTIALQGLYPRALAASADGTKVYTAFLLSGNRTTVLTAAEVIAAGTTAFPTPVPTNTALPEAPKTAKIVPVTDSHVVYTVLDNDVAEINAATNTVTRYFTGAGTNLFDIAVQPTSGDLWVPNTEARNLVAFEPQLRGHVVDNRVTKLMVSNASAWPYDLNPDINYSILPNPAAQANALAQPTSAIFSADGNSLWVAAFASDRIAKVNTSGAVLGRVDVRTPPAGGGDTSSRRMRGPRGLVLNSAGTRLYVLNKLANTVSVIDPAALTVLGEVPNSGFEPQSVTVRQGRGFLFDARLSGNGTVSCGSCHIDADLDGIAWDLGDPGGSMVVVKGSYIAAHVSGQVDRNIHPMKGPLTTQTLRGMQDGAPFHWRGDRPTLQSFNPTFDKLMAGSQIATADIDAMAAYLRTLFHHPNPNKLVTNAIPGSFAGGDVSNGRTLFNDHLVSHCSVCHVGITGSNNNLDDFNLTGSRDEVKTPPMRTVYQRLFLNRTAGSQNITGYGLGRDGTLPGNFLPIAHFYDLDQLEGKDFADVKAYVLCFDTGTPSSAAFQLTVTAATVVAATNDIGNLEAQSRALQNDLAVQGIIGGKARSYFYNRSTQSYVSDKAGEASLNSNQFRALIGPTDVVTFTGTPAGLGLRRGGDRNLNGVRDADETGPAMTFYRPNSNFVGLTWPEGAWTLEGSASPTGPWSTVLLPRQRSNGQISLDYDPVGANAGFFRFRRTW